MGFNSGFKGLKMYQRFGKKYFIHIRRRRQAVRILIVNQLDAQFFYNTFIYLNPLHVSSTFVLILRRTIV